MSSLTEKYMEGVIIEQGKASNTFYIIKSGTVAVVNDSKEIAQLKVRYAIITSSWMQACTAYESLYARAKCRLDNSSESARF